MAKTSEVSPEKRSSVFVCIKNAPLFDSSEKKNPSLLHPPQRGQKFTNGGLRTESAHADPKKISTADWEA